MTTNPTTPGPQSWPCDNYRSPLTCLTAPSSETGRCDWCGQVSADARAEGERAGREAWLREADARWRAEATPDDLDALKARRDETIERIRAVARAEGVREGAARVAAADEALVERVAARAGLLPDEYPLTTTRLILAALADELGSDG